MLKCPYCNQEFKSLNKHVFYKHGKTTNEVRKEFPDVILQEININMKQNCSCQYCNRIFTTKLGLINHINHKHPEHHIESKKYKCKEQPHYKCGICGKETNIIYGHVIEKHHIKWDEYCAQYKHNINEKTYISETHKKQLSINKKKFYESEIGLQERARLSKKYAGENNPAVRPEVRKKISDAAIKRMLDNPNENKFFDYSYGIRFNFSYNNKNYYTRSFEEFKVLYTLLKNNISFEYETKIINYTLNNINKKYVVDLIINKMYIEIKADKNINKFYQLEKYKTISDILSKLGKKLYIVNLQLLCQLLNIKDIPLEFEIIQFIQQLLKNDKCTISYICQTGKNSSVLERIDKNYKNNKNIKFRSLQNDI